MRLSVNLEDDLYAIAKSLAKSEDCSLSAAVNLLVRRAVEGPPDGTPTFFIHPVSGLPVSRGRRLITSEDVAAIEDET